MATHFAAINLASFLLHEALDLPWAWADPIDPVWDELVSSTGEADVAAAALRLVVDWGVSHRKDFYKHLALERDQPISGWAGRWDT